MEMEVPLDVAKALGAHEARLNNLEGWQKTQNGHLRSIDEKLDSLKSWLIGLLGGMVVSLTLLVINLVRG